MTVDFSVNVALGDFTLDVAAHIADGEVLAILGPNGAGKSTLLRALSGLRPIDTGTIRHDETVWDCPARSRFVATEKRNVGAVFQDYLLFETMSVLENVAFGLRSRGVNKYLARSKAGQLLEQVGLAAFADRLPTVLSGGQAQRVALARALAVDPSLLLLDEPLSALDISTRQSLRRDLHRHLSQFGGATVLVTHDPIDAYSLADRIMIIEKGSMVQTGTVAEVTSHPRSRYVADLVGMNLVSGIADGTRLLAGDASIVLADACQGAVFALIRPQAITIVKSAEPLSSARNSWPCTVGDIDRFGERVRVSLHGPLPLIAEITIGAVESLGLQIGDPVFAMVKATDIEVYDR